MTPPQLAQPQYDAETRFLIRALANAHLLIDEETNIVECLFCGMESPDNPEGFAHESNCPILRAQKWLDAQAIESTAIIVEEEP
jgi:hypothetical protein